MSQVENVKPKGPKNTKLLLVRYGRMGVMGWFEHHESHVPKLNTHVVIKTERGLELGQIVGEHCYRGGQFKNTPEQIEEYYCNRTKDFPIGEGGTLVRFATSEDVHEQQHLEKNAVSEAKTCQKIADELDLKMKVIEAEHLFGGERIIFYFTSESRVDFRELVKRLAKEYQTRIELRQIGSRDEARLISDYETCGQQCCCSRFLKILEPVNMRMAKLQKATLDPSKISGHCGRLKCCLRYEDLTYQQLRKNLPRKGATVQTPKGTGKVMDVQVLTQLVVVQDELGDRQAWPVEEIKRSYGQGPDDGPDEQEFNEDAPISNKEIQELTQTTVLEDLQDEAQTEQDWPSENPSSRPKEQRRPNNRPNGNSSNQQNQRDQQDRRDQAQRSDGQNDQQRSGRRNRRGRNRRRRPNKNEGQNRPQNQQNQNKPQGGSEQS